jgi:peptide/nickel transport system permease protein
MSMTKYIVRRLLQMIPVIFGVLILTFFLARAMPGDPVEKLLQAQGLPKPDFDVIEAKRRQLGLDDPIIVQFFRYMFELFTGQWGVSVVIARNQPVWDLIAERMPRTIDLSLFSMTIASFIGIKTGVISATHRNQTKDTLYRGIALVGVAIPVFFLGMLLQYVLGYLFPIFPATGYKSARIQNPPFVTGFPLIDSIVTVELKFMIDYLYHLMLPVFCLSFITLAGIVRQTRSSMLEVLEQDYIRTARAKGCKEKDVINTHALKNSLIPTITVIGLGFAGLLGGAVLTETTFGLAGMGLLFVKAITLTDYWLLQALVFLIALIFVFATLITDLLYAYLDPRIRY